MDSEPPPGFVPLFRTSPFLDLLGPFFHRKEPDGTFVVGLRILPKHANARGTAHGGLLMTLLDIAIGYRTLVEPGAAGRAHHRQHDRRLTRRSDSPAMRRPRSAIGVEAHVDVQKVGGRLAFANAFLVVDGERVVRGSAVFSRVPALS